MTSVEINAIDHRIFVPLETPKARVIEVKKKSSSSSFYILEEAIPAFSVDANKVMFANEVEWERLSVFRAINYQYVYVYLFGTSANLILRNSNNQYFAVAPNSLGIMQATPTTYSGTLRTSDLNVGTVMFGFIRPSGTRKVYIQNNIVKNSAVSDSSLSAYFSSNVAFDYGYGPVFTDGSDQYRLIVTNNKSVASQKIS